MNTNKRKEEAATTTKTNYPNINWNARYLLPFYKPLNALEESMKSYTGYFGSVIIGLLLISINLGTAEIALGGIAFLLIQWHYYNDKDRTAWTWKDPDVERIKSFISNLRLSYG